jgi:hypothetical protein
LAFYVFLLWAKVFKTFFLFYFTMELQCFFGFLFLFFVMCMKYFVGINV